MQERLYVLQNLDCAHCAAQIESDIKKLPTVENVSLNFLNKQLRLHLAENVDISNLEAEVEKLIKRREPDVNLLELSDTEKTAENGAEGSHTHGSDSHIADFKKDIILIVTAAICFIFGLIVKNIMNNEVFSIILFIIVLLLAGGSVFFCRHCVISLTVRYLMKIF